MLKLNYSFSTPFTNSKNTKEVYFPISPLESEKRLEAVSKRLKYDEKGRI